MNKGAAGKARALRRAKELGCTGAHKHPDGGWMACSTHEEYERLEAEEESEQEEKSVLSRVREFQSVRERKGKRRKKKNKKNWEKLGERGVVSIDTITGGGLVSGAVAGKVASAIPRDGEEDVFTDINSARRRARQLGCIGVARRRSTGGQVVWTPCSNITDYARRTGSTALGRRYIERMRRQEARRIVEEERKRGRYKRKISLFEELHGKALGRKIRQAAAVFDANATDGDNDGMVQDGTAFARPAIPKGVGKSKTWKDLIEMEPGWMSEAPKNIQRAASQEAREKHRKLRVSGLRSQQTGSGGRAQVSRIMQQVMPEHRGKEDRTLYFIGGTTGAGKSTLTRNDRFGIPGPDAAAHIDPDEIKAGLVGWDNGRGAGAVHDSSRRVTDHAMKAAAEEKTDMVVQGTGKRTEHLQMARQNGYATVGHFVHIPGDEADRRIVQRNADNRQNGGAIIPEWFGSQIGRELQPIVPRQITSGLFDEFFLWDNSGDTPVLIAKRTKDGNYNINDIDAFNDFFSPTGAEYVKNYWDSKSSS